jgi:hypothetical protein
MKFTFLGNFYGDKPYVVELSFESVLGVFSSIFISFLIFLNLVVQISQ